MARYEQVGRWYIVEVIDEDITVETSDAHDKRTGHLYHGGVYRVSGPGIRTKRWYGETAWSRANSFALDAFWARRNK